MHTYLLCSEATGIYEKESYLGVKNEAFGYGTTAKSQGGELERLLSGQRTSCFSTDPAHTWRLTTVRNSSVRGFNVLFLFPQALCARGT